LDYLGYLNREIEEKRAILLRIEKKRGVAGHKNS